MGNGRLRAIKCSWSQMIFKNSSFIFDSCCNKNVHLIPKLGGYATVCVCVCVCVCCLCACVHAVCVCVCVWCVWREGVEGTYTCLLHAECFKVAGNNLEDDTSVHETEGLLYQQNNQTMIKLSKEMIKHHRLHVITLTKSARLLLAFYKN